jgi:membrane protease YdiL (CAAX protease family)
VTLLDYALALVAYPVLEEFIFRLHLMELAATRFPAWRPDAVNVAVSGVFSLAHAAAWPWPHAAAVFLPSFVLGRLMQRTGSWSLCALIHGLMNAFYLFAT